MVVTPNLSVLECEGESGWGRLFDLGEPALFGYQGLVPRRNSHRNHWWRRVVGALVAETNHHRSAVYLSCENRLYFGGKSVGKGYIFSLDCTAVFQFVWSGLWKHRVFVPKAKGGNIWNENIIE